MRLPVGVVWATVLAAAGAAVPFLLRRKDPREKERRRRELIALRGRAIEGCALESIGSVVVSTYEWRGVRYEASQDISEVLQTETATQSVSGAVTVKFLSASPANSIVIAENWSGIPGLARGAKSR